MSHNKQTAEFLYLLCCYLKANPGCLIAVSDFDKETGNKLQIGYYDDVYCYVRPEMVIPMFRAVAFPDYEADMLQILRELFAADFIKVHWILSGEVRYRPQKRIGSTRKRYITFYRRKLEPYMDKHFKKEAEDEND